jgi:hypothetical protein
MDSELEDLFDWDEYLNGKKVRFDVTVFQFFHSRLLYQFTDYDSEKFPAPQLARM